MASYMYPRRARKALGEIISKKLNIEKVSKKHVSAILEFGFHENLPTCFYNEATAFDINNLKFLPSECIKLNDLRELIARSNFIDTRLYNAVLLYRKELMVDGLNPIKLMIVHGLLTNEDAEYIIENKILTPMQLLKMDPSLATKRMSICKDDLVKIVTHIPSHAVPGLYNNLTIDLDTLLYMSDVFDVAPTNDGLFALTDTEKAIELVKKYPNNNVITYLPDAVKHTSVFIQSMHELVVFHFPNMLTAVNNFIYTVTPEKELIKEYGVKCFAMFPIRPYADALCVKNEEDSAFIETNISLYDSRCRVFANEFREMIKHKQNRTIPPSRPGWVLNQKQSCKLRCSMKKCTKHEENDVEEVLMHIDNLMLDKHKIDYECINSLISPFKLDPRIVRNIIRSGVGIKTKLITLKIIKSWKSYTCANICSFRKIKGVIIMDTMDHIVAKLLRYYKQAYDVLESRAKMSLARCRCKNCSFVFIEGMFKSKNLTIHERSSDDDLTACVFDLVRYAVHGMINPTILDVSDWGLLSGLYSGSRTIKTNLYSMMDLENLNTCDVILTGTNMGQKLVSVTATPLRKLLPFCYFPLNEYYVKVISVLNIITEYIMAFILYRLVIIQRLTNIKTFLYKITNVALEAAGVNFCHLKVHDNIETEIDELITQGTMPVHVTHLILKVVIVIFDELIR
ncbi:gp036L [Rabbit fibroma virus]|uniref:Gp036L n=1 Tax=Rabbit fibroma virus (strain Kasza) TaxID=10272 RepID=Q9Q935_RFVKA|nr:Hypothetical protein SFV_s036L [Rabbit fibroma virus]AAF17918.1 gp036L [Rabbit fibroma virus]